MQKLVLLSMISALFMSCSQTESESQTVRSGNPVIKGWYADPEGIIFNDEYWIFPTYSDHYEGPYFFSIYRKPT